MKFHAVALCVAGTLVTGIAANADTHRDRDNNYGSVQAERIEVERRDRMSSRYQGEDPVTGTSYHAGEWLHYREVLWPYLPPKREVAQKVSRLVDMQRMEIAHLRALAPRAQTAGFTNITTVYDHMANDHAQLVNFATDWLRTHGFRVPAEPAVEAAAINMEPHDSVHHQIQMHERMFNEALAARQGERSPTVRTMHLWAAATSMRHLSLLRSLDRDVEFGRKTVSARLRSMMDGNFVASSETERLIVEEEMALFRTISPTETVVAIQPQPAQVIAVETIVERPVERIVERPVERVVERIVERPVERVVERRVYVERVAGRRQQRRPAK